MSLRKLTVPAFCEAAARGEKLAMLTAYDHLWAGLVDQAGVDSVLVGDSLGMVIQGHSTTLPVTLDQMIYHAQIVVRAVRRALVIVDLPFMSYHVSVQQAVESAGRIIQETGADAVKLEGGRPYAETIRAIQRAEIPVMAHIGMRPQSVRTTGTMGKVQRDEQQLLDDAQAVEEAGAFGILLELIPAQAARKVTESVSIPTIGIGAGPYCSGQVLVGPDMLGLTADFRPRFLKQYADLRATATEAVRQYVQEVRDAQFPDDAHSHT